MWSWSPRASGAHWHDQPPRLQLEAQTQIHGPMRAEVSGESGHAGRLKKKCGISLFLLALQFRAQKHSWRIIIFDWVFSMGERDKSGGVGESDIRKKYQLHVACFMSEIRGDWQKIFTPWHFFLQLEKKHGPCKMLKWRVCWLLTALCMWVWYSVCSEV